MDLVLRGGTLFDGVFSLGVLLSLCLHVGYIWLSKLQRYVWIKKIHLAYKNSSVALDPKMLLYMPN